jgi:hypothetical protein
MKMFTSPDDLDLFNLSLVFEACNVGRGNLAISKLKAKNNCTFFVIYILGNDTFYIFGRWCQGKAHPVELGGRREPGNKCS